MQTDMTRRQALERAAIGAGAVLLGGPVALAAGKTKPKRKPKAKLPKLPKLSTVGAFTLGIGAGYPTTTGATLWTRVDDLEKTSYVGLEIATDAAFKHVVQRSRVKAERLRDYTVHTNVAKLKPATEYFYRFYTKHADSPVGRLRTLRPADSNDPVRIGIFSCQDYEAGYYNAHTGLAAEQDLDLIVCLGDYIYEHPYYKGPAARADHTGPNKDGDVQTLDEYRSKYRLYKADANLQAVHAKYPFIPIWDDHEVEDNYAGNQPDSASTSPDQTENDNAYARRVPFSERQRAAYLSFNEYHPRLRTKPVTTRIYDSYSLGKVATLYLTDQRQYRTPQPCKDQIAVPCADDTNPNATMLGQAQKDWFKNGLANDQAIWKLWGSEVMVSSWDSAPGVPLNQDGWDGYAHERQEILEFVKAKGISNLAVLTGDIHTYVASTLYTTGRLGGQPVGTEFVGGAITSLGLDSLFPSSLGSLVQTLQATNPHISFINATRRGYMTVVATPTELNVAYRSPETTMDPNAPVKTLAAFKVAAGSTVVQRV